MTDNSSVTQRLIECLRAVVALDSRHGANSKINVDLLTTTDDPSKLHLLSDLNLDSITVVEFAMEVEEAFDVEIEDDDLYAAETFGDFCKLVGAT